MYNKNIKCYLSVQGSMLIIQFLLRISVPTNISLSRYETVTRVRTDPGEYWDLKFTFSRTGKSWNQAKVLRSHVNENSCCDNFFFDDLSE